MRGCHPSRACLLVLFLLLTLCGGSVRPAAAQRTPGYPDPAERLRILTGMERARVEAPGKAVESQNDYDVRTSRLEIDITDTAHHLIQGKATHRIQSLVPGLSDILLDLANQLNVDAVTVDGRPVAFSHPLDEVHVFPLQPLAVGQIVTVAVSYSGAPVSGSVGLYFDTHSGEPFIYNLSEPDGCRNWWPCKDHPDDKADSVDVVITCPNWMTATSNGLLQAVVSGPQATHTYFWHCGYPIAPYLVSLTAGDFVRLDSSYPIPGGGLMPLAHYVFPEQVAAAQADFSIAPDAIQAFADRFGPYPFLREKYGITVFGWGGAMEHQTNTSYGWFLINGYHYYDYIYVHELGHQWWGDNVTCATWDDCWLNEGFASWCEAVWYEDQFGFQSYRDYMVNSQVVNDPSGPVYGFPEPFDGNTVYNKGSWVMYMLRQVLGDGPFYSALAAYRSAYQGKSVTTAQFQTIFENSSGRDLSWFFDEWVYGMNRPHYRLSTFSEPISGGRRLYVHLDQTQTNAGFFTMPVPIRVTAGSVYNVVLWNDPDHEDLTVDLPVAPTAVVVDPDQTILRTTATGVYGLNLVSADLDSVPIGSPVSVPLIARGGTLPYHWSALDPPPQGIILDPSTGLLSGTPGTPGDYAFRVIVRDTSVPAVSDTQRIFWSILGPSGASESAGHFGPAALRVIPNPASGQVVLSLNVSGRGSVDWRVIDLSGRVLWRRTTSIPADGSLRWDGRDQGGRAMPAGIYWVRAQIRQEGGGDTEAIGRVLLVE